MMIVTVVCIAISLVSALLCIIRALRGPSVPDRAIALDALVVVLVNGLGIMVVRNGDGLLIDAILVIGLLGFVATLTVARFAESRGSS
jgi:multicomponent Na+:H+ antiporter subunit F